MKKVLPALALALCSPALWAEGVALPKSVQASFEQHCLECHDAETKKGGLNLEKLGTQFGDAAQFEAWLKVHDRIRAGEMPPKKKKARPPQGDLDSITSWLNAELSAADKERQTKDVRVGVRRLSRVEFENTLRDLLGLPGLRVQASLPADGKAHGFDRGAEALDFSFVHLDSYLSAVDTALLAATPAHIEQPAVATHHWRPQEDNSIALLNGQKEAIGLIGLLRDLHVPEHRGRRAEGHCGRRLSPRRCGFSLWNGTLHAEARRLLSHSHQRLQLRVGWAEAGADAEARRGGFRRFRAGAQSRDGRPAAKPAGRRRDHRLA
jgi:cytochrome c551/c552